MLYTSGRNHTAYCYSKLSKLRGVLASKLILADCDCDYDDNVPPSLTSPYIILKVFHAPHARIASSVYEKC